jgi:hypothetical protein
MRDRGTDKNQQDDMTRWEYRLLRADWHSGNLMVQSEETNTRIPLEGELARLGADGWEAVSLQHAPMVPGGRLVVLLKRPLGKQEL